MDPPVRPSGDGERMANGVGQSEAKARKTESSGCARSEASEWPSCTLGTRGPRKARAAGSREGRAALAAAPEGPEPGGPGGATDTKEMA